MMQHRMVKDPYAQTPLILNKICYDYGRRQKQGARVLDEISLECQAGTWTAIMGPSGAGKSTLLYCAAGLLQVRQGSVAIAGEDLTRMKEWELTRLRRDHIGFVFQDYNLVNAFTCLQNTMLSSLFGGRKISAQAALSALSNVGLEGYANTYPADMSGGQQQRVAIARSLAASPEIIMADEPTGALDTHSSREVMDLFDLAVRSGQTILMVTHDPNVAARAHRVIFLQDGRIQAACPGGDPQTIAQQLASMDAVPNEEAFSPPLAVPSDQPR
ncbi:ABC transporter ATP-binding protein [Bifidobacterium sp. ESL0822]|uniref:ABC transporter ATP-binding protein n=1 Tax=Bifidobacterium sp. ESL0822 TaxID=3448585 RepID=UPI004042108D